MDTLLTTVLLSDNVAFEHAISHHAKVVKTSMTKLVHAMLVHAMYRIWLLMTHLHMVTDDSPTFGY